MYTAVVIGIVFTIMHQILQVSSYANSYIGNLSNIEYPYSVFHISLLFDTNAVYPLYYAYIFPLLAALPFASSYYEELKTNYGNQLVLRGGNERYLISKYIAVFITAGTAVVIPLVLDMMATMTCIPALMPQEGTALFGVGYSSWMGTVFYTHPFFYFFLYGILLFILAGILASLALAASRFLTGKYIVMFVPYIMTLVLESILEFAGRQQIGVFSIVFSGEIYRQDVTLVFLIWGVIGVISFQVYYWGGGKRHDKL
jgi:hypothetical protein